MDSVGEGEGGEIWENGIETCIISCMKRKKKTKKKSTSSIQSSFRHKNVLFKKKKKTTDGMVQFSSVQSLSCVQLFATPWIAARQASLSITNSQSLPIHVHRVIQPSSHLILCCPLLLLPPIPPSIRVFANESTLHMRWPKCWNFSFSISPSNGYLTIILIISYQNWIFYQAASSNYFGG